MKVTLCTGSPHSGQEQVFELLVQAGVAKAHAASQGALTPQNLQTKLLNSQEVDLLGTAPLAQVLPGKLWSRLASDLFLANIHHTAWGWADDQTTVLMDFWKDFDPQVRLLLVYNSPQAYLAQVLDQHTAPSPQFVAATLNEWTRWNTALLRYYHRHPICCVLVNAQQACAQPQRFVATLAAHWQISGLDSTTVSVAGTPEYPHLQAHLISQLIDPHHPALALHQELEGAALLIATPSADPTADAAPSATTAWSDWVQVRTSLAQLTQEKIKLIAVGEELVRARVELSTQLDSETQAKTDALAQRDAEANAKSEALAQRDQLANDKAALTAARDEQAKLAAEWQTALTTLQTQHDRLAQENSKLIADSADSTRAKAKLEAQLAERPQAAQVAAQLADHQHESELLLLQLHQVQEELEHYFLLHQELQQQQKQQEQPTELRVDMRQDVVGSNWYHPEVDGCWAGPTTVSTLQIQPVQAGNYTLSLEVVDAMHPDIVQNMEFEALGQSARFEIESLTPDADYPLVCKARLCIAADTPPVPWHISLRFTHLVSPAESGGDDHRRLAIRLQTLRLSKNI
ncbi:hypothetical protein [Rhodoferax sp.]|uniref:hypothetical protein n=1 Tax=Rhodoferax sp. TaxID=50421 RepID=UPI0027474E30|nr:hypothetical protein [Rhodoferax sp.]